MKINSCTNLHFLRKIEVFNVYRPSNKKSYFSRNKHVLQKDTFSSSAYYMTRAHNSLKFTLFAQIWHFYN